jgi:small subunit ribosomal protein S3Ae
MAPKQSQKQSNKKGSKKKVGDSFLLKEWYDIKAPNVFTEHHVGKTLVNRSQGLRNCEDDLKDRTVEVSLADLNKDEQQAHNKITLKVLSVHGKTCLTNFDGMTITSDKLQSCVKKWKTFIEAHVDVKTTDGYLIRVFTMGTTKAQPNQVKKTAYAKTSKVREIRKKMMEISTREASNSDLKGFVLKIGSNVIGEAIIKATYSIYPLENVMVRKVKLLKTPKVDMQKLMEMHSGAAEELGAKVDRSEFKEPAILAEV